MDATRDYHTKVKSERKRQIPYDITYMLSLKYDTKEAIRNRITDIEKNRQVGSKGERDGMRG